MCLAGWLLLVLALESAAARGCTEVVFPSNCSTVANVMQQQFHLPFHLIPADPCVTPT
jgi:hypothetical protein